MTSLWRVYLRLGRVSNLPTVWTNCLAGVILAGASPEPVSFALLLASMCLLYVSGMFLNDAFDQEFDRKYRPERPIPSGEIPGRHVYAIGFGLMLAGLAILLASTIEAILWGSALSALIVYYNYRHKRDPASPSIMALCRVMVYFCAAAATGGTALTPKVIGGAAVLMAYMIGLTYVAKQENLTEVKNLWPLVFLAAPFLYAYAVAPGILYPLFLAWVLYALSHLFKAKKNIPRAVVSLIAGISLLDGVLIAEAAPLESWSWLGIAGFLLTLFFQRYVSGT